MTKITLLINRLFTVVIVFVKCANGLYILCATSNEFNRVICVSTARLIYCRTIEDRSITNVLGW